MQDERPKIQTIRQPVVAGKFYPGLPDTLRAVIEHAFLSPLGPGVFPAVQQGPRRLVGIVAPHAGYPYSGQGAAWAYAEVARDGRPEAVIILGVNHLPYGSALALSPATGWETPLGIMPVATALGERLQALDAAVVADARGHLKEHSLEVQVPFLQVLFGALPILPIAIGHSSVAEVLRLGLALAVLAQEYDVLIVASSDFSHYISQSAAERLDRLALERIIAVDAEGLIRVVHEYGITMCGVLPVAAMLMAALQLGVRKGTLLHYHTSGDVTGDRQEVVGYGTAALYR